MKKKVLATLNKCYSIAPLKYMNEDYILVASEKNDPCYLFDLDGNVIATIWDEPGGTMSMAQVPDSNGIFLATQKFYSPDDSIYSEIDIVYPTELFKWQTKKLCHLPFIHRFGILKTPKENYLIACTIKSSHTFIGDFSPGGKIFAAPLPKDILNIKEPFRVNVIKDELYHNHGFYIIHRSEGDFALTSSDEGVFKVDPPSSERTDWEISQLIEDPTSDATLCDLNGDGKDELITISPFHGNKLKIYELDENNKYQLKYQHPDNMPFLHAIWTDKIDNKPCVVLGYREGEQELLQLIFDTESHSYKCNSLDKHCGPANAFIYHNKGKDVIISANREIDEVAMYTSE